MEKSRVRTITEVGLSIALFAVLDYFNVRLPINIAGGSISLAMTPILVLAVFRGPAIGALAGVLCGGVDLMISPFVLNIFQVFLDYPIAFGLVGLAGLVKKPLETAFKANKKSHMGAWIFTSIIIAALGRFTAHLFSGVIFFASNAPAGQNVWAYSALYQIQYLLPSFIGCGIVCAVVIPSLLNYFWSE